jgi:3-oxoacyl-[acyl-carrier protein] reductase
VTGSARGIGAATAERLAEDGAAVALADLDIAGAEVTAAQIAARCGVKTIALKANVADAGEVERMVDEIVLRLGSLDILVNNAATLDHVAQIESQSDELWDRDVTVNVTGAYNCTKAAFTHMRKAGGGRIVYMSSVAGSLGGFGQASYAATKSAMVGLARTTALEGARYGITANVVAPGIIATEAFKMGNPKMNDRMVLRTAMRAPGEPEDVASAIVFLCSPEARYITGQVLHVAGGIDLFTF